MINKIEKFFPSPNIFKKCKFCIQHRYIVIHDGGVHVSVKCIFLTNRNRRIQDSVLLHQGGEHAGVAAHELLNRNEALPEKQEEQDTKKEELAGDF